MPYCDLVWHEFRHPEEVISSAHEPGSELGLGPSLESRPSEPSHGLHPAEYLFTPLSYPLAYGVSGMAGGAAVYSEAASPFYIGSHVGRLKTMEMILTGERVDAQEAYRIGLVNKVVPHGELMKAAEEMAAKIMSRGGAHGEAVCPARRRDASG